MKSRVGGIVLQCVIKNKIDIVLSISVIRMSRTYLEVLDLTIFILFNLLIDRRPAHWLLDDLIIIGNFDPANKMEKQILAVHSVMLVIYVEDKRSH